MIFSYLRYLELSSCMLLGYSLLGSNHQFGFRLLVDDSVGGTERCAGMDLHCRRACLAPAGRIRDGSRGTLEDSSSLDLIPTREQSFRFREFPPQNISWAESTVHRVKMKVAYYEETPPRPCVSMTLLIRWNLGKVLELTPDINIKEALADCLQKLDVEPNTGLYCLPRAVAGVSCAQQRHLSCVILAWQSKGETDFNSLLELAERVKMEILSGRHKLRKKNVNVKFDEKSNRNIFKTTRVIESYRCETLSDGNMSTRSRKAVDDEIIQFISSDRSISHKSVKSTTTIRESINDYLISFTGPVIKLPLGCSTIKPMVTPNKDSNKSGDCNNMQMPCVYSDNCVEKLRKLNAATESLRERAGCLSRRDAERSALLERAELAWADMERGFKRRLDRLEDNIQIILRRISKLLNSRKVLKGTCVSINTEMEQKNELLAKLTEDNSELSRQIEEVVEDRTRVARQLRLLQEIVDTETASEAHLSQNLLLIEENKAHKTRLLNEAYQSQRLVTTQMEDTVRAELESLRNQFKEVAEKLLVKNEANITLKNNVNHLSEIRNSYVHEMEDYKTEKTEIYYNLLKEIKSLYEKYEEVKEYSSGCVCRMPSENGTQLARSRSLACLREEVAAREDCCKCASARARVMAALLRDVVGGARRALGAGAAPPVPCALLRCLRDDHDWRQRTAVATRLGIFFYVNLRDELDTAIATAIERKHEEWISQAYEHRKDGNNTIFAPARPDRCEIVMTANVARGRPPQFSPPQTSLFSTPQLPAERSPQHARSSMNNRAQKNARDSASARTKLHPRGWTHYLDQVKSRLCKLNQEAGSRYEINRMQSKMSKVTHNSSIKARYMDYSHKAKKKYEDYFHENCSRVENLNRNEQKCNNLFDKKFHTFQFPQSNEGYDIQNKYIKTDHVQNSSGKRASFVKNRLNCKIAVNCINDELRDEYFNLQTNNSNDFQCKTDTEDVFYDCEVIESCDSIYNANELESGNSILLNQDLNIYRNNAYTNECNDSFRSINKIDNFENKNIKSHNHNERNELTSQCVRKYTTNPVIIENENEIVKNPNNQFNNYMDKTVKYTRLVQSKDPKKVMSFDSWKTAKSKCSETKKLMASIYHNDCYDGEINQHNINTLREATNTHITNPSTCPKISKNYRNKRILIETNSGIKIKNISNDILEELLQDKEVSPIRKQSIASFYLKSCGRKKTFKSFPKRQFKVDPYHKKCYEESKLSSRCNVVSTYTSSKKNTKIFGKIKPHKCNFLDTNYSNPCGVKKKRKSVYTNKKSIESQTSDHNKEEKCVGSRKHSCLCEFKKLGMLSIRDENTKSVVGGDRFGVGPFKGLLVGDQFPCGIKPAHKKIYDLSKAPAAQLTSITSVSAKRPIPKLSIIPSLPGLPSLPELPGMPSLPGLPSISGLPGMSSLSGFNSVSGLPSVSGIGVPSLSILPALPTVNTEAITSSLMGLRNSITKAICDIKNTFFQTSQNIPKNIVKGEENSEKNYEGNNEENVEENDVLLPDCDTCYIDSNEKEGLECPPPCYCLPPVNKNHFGVTCDNIMWNLDECMCGVKRPGLLFSRKNSSKTCVCCNSEKLIPKSNIADELEINAFDILEKHIKTKINTMVCTCSPDNPKLFDKSEIQCQILQKIQEIIKSDLARLACKCKAPEISYENAAFGLLEEFIKSKIDEIKCICLSKDRIVPEDILSNTLDTIKYAIDKDIEKLKCLNIVKNVPVEVSVDEIKDEPCTCRSPKKEIPIEVSTDVDEDSPCKCHSPKKEVSVEVSIDATEDGPCKCRSHKKEVPVEESIDATEDGPCKCLSRKKEVPVEVKIEATEDGPCKCHYPKEEDSVELKIDAAEKGTCVCYSPKKEVSVEVSIDAVENKYCTCLSSKKKSTHNSDKSKNGSNDSCPKNCNVTYNVDVIWPKYKSNLIKNNQLEIDRNREAHMLTSAFGSSLSSNNKYDKIQKLQDVYVQSNSNKSIECNMSSEIYKLISTLNKELSLDIPTRGPLKKTVNGSKKRKFV